MEKQYYTYANPVDGSTMACVVGTTYCMELSELIEYAKGDDDGRPAWELEEIPTPKDFDLDNLPDVY